jgi:hypothetical protein
VASEPPLELIGFCAVTHTRLNPDIDSEYGCKINVGPASFASDHVIAETALLVFFTCPVVVLQKRPHSPPPKNHTHTLALTGQLMHSYVRKNSTQFTSIIKPQ